MSSYMKFSWVRVAVNVVICATCVLIIDHYYPLTVFWKEFLRVFVLMFLTDMAVFFVRHIYFALKYES